MGRPRRARSSRKKIEPWELARIKSAARRIRTSERDELEAELARRLLDLKARLPSGIQDWDAYLSGFLRNKAANWIRDRRLKEARGISLHQPRAEESGEGLTYEDVLKSPELDPDDRVAFARFWEALDADLRRVWELLLEERGNQAEVARRLGKHRNTIRLWIRKIQRTLKQHGFRAGS